MVGALGGVLLVLDLFVHLFLDPGGTLVEDLDPLVGEGVGVVEALVREVDAVEVVEVQVLGLVESVAHDSALDLGIREIR